MSHFRDIFEAWIIVSVGGFALLCLIWYARSVIRDFRLRGRRISNAEIHRERITIQIPFALRDFKDRS